MDWAAVLEIVTWAMLFWLTYEFLGWVIDHIKNPARYECPICGLKMKSGDFNFIAETSYRHAVHHQIEKEN